ncbi:GSCFA domain-containing protein [Flavobacterium sp.]|uniref:GSCFA domain-containing protein n=1 Tax=Flavobacterium sp. TaxID=239 RepID=UPI0025E63E5A|nr:GSCFA domain-containing protein [Flavobacterium sp.]
MHFTTKVPVKSYEYPINYSSKLLLLGSCFAENIGEKFDYFKFQTTTNPFGIIFNPVSIEKLVKRAVNRKVFTDADVFFHNDLWHSYDVHSGCSHSDKEILLKQLNAAVEVMYRQIVEASHILITYGTSWVYRLKATNEIVANCHKVPQNEFTKEILSPETTAQSIQNTMNLIRQINPEVMFIFTISPVRHTKDGFPENQRSKAHLIAAVHATVLDNTKSNYFPSYEIMMDELRDYRFYADDMLHPSQKAIDYIWIRFFENYINADCFDIMQEVCNIQKGLAHRPFNPETKQHQHFLETINQKIIRLQSQFPHFQF